MFSSHGSPPHDKYPSDPFEPRLLIPPPEHRRLVPVIWDPNRVDPRPVTENSSKANESERIGGSRFNPYGNAHQTAGSGVTGYRNIHDMNSTAQWNGTNVQANRQSKHAWMMYHAPTPMVFAVTTSINFDRQEFDAFDHFDRAAAMALGARNLVPLRGYPFPAQHFEENRRQHRFGLAEHNQMCMNPGVPHGPDRIPDFIYIQNGFGAGLPDDEGNVVSVDDDEDDFEQEILSSGGIVKSNKDMDEDEELSSVNYTETEEMKEM